MPGRAHHAWRRQHHAAPASAASLERKNRSTSSPCGSDDGAPATGPCSGAAAASENTGRPPRGATTRHALEIGYVFADNRSSGGLSLRPYWLQFARTGDPNGPGLAVWPRWAATTQRHMAFEENGFAARSGLRDEICGKLERL